MQLLWLRRSVDSSVSHARCLRSGRLLLFLPSHHLPIILYSSTLLLLCLATPIHMPPKSVKKASQAADRAPRRSARNRNHLTTKVDIASTEKATGNGAKSQSRTSSQGEARGRPQSERVASLSESFTSLLVKCHVNATTLTLSLTQKLASHSKCPSQSVPRRYLRRHISRQHVS